MSTTIVELNQDDINSVSNIDGGDYTVTLKQPILVNKNDSVILKSCFIDNRVSNSKSIVIKGDKKEDGTYENFQSISVGFGYYKTDIEGTWEEKAPTTTYDQNEQITATNLGTFTGRRYPAYIQLSGASTNNVDLIEIDLWADFKVQNLGPSDPLVQYSTKSFVIPYSDGGVIKKRTLVTTWSTQWYLFQHGDGLLSVDPKTKRKILKLTQPLIEELKAKNYFKCNFTLPLTCQKPTGTETIQDLAVAPNHVIISDVTDQPHQSSGNGTFDIYTQEIDFQIPVGVYPPDKIANLLKEKIISFSGNLSSKDFEVSENPLLKTVQQIRINENKSLQFFDMDENTQRRFTFDTGTGNTGDNTLLNYYIGSSQFGLDYNEDTQKMEIVSIHNSLFSSQFDATTGAPLSQSISPEIRIVRNKALTISLPTITQAMVDASKLKATKFVCNSNCGIYLTKLEPEELWIGADSQFKFSNDIFPVYKNRVITVTKENGSVEVSTVMGLQQLEEGIHVTSDESGLDEIITKQLKTGSANNFDIPQLQSFDIQKPLLPGEGIFSEIVGVNTIEAVDTVGSSVLTDGAYYKVSVDMGIKSNIYGNNNRNNVSSIISKFYSQNSFTSSYTEGSIPYLHQSDEPIYINEIRVRILDPDNSLSPSVGNKNAVFLEINTQ